MKQLKSLRFFFTIIMFALVGGISCSADKEDMGNDPPPTNECASIQAKFAANVLPIIQSRCATNSGCHGTGSVNGPGELITYAQISSKAGVINDAAVINSRMPKTGGPLTAAQKAILKCWISSGALNN